MAFITMGLWYCAQTDEIWAYITSGLDTVRVRDVGAVVRKPN